MAAAGAGAGAGAGAADALTFLSSLSFTIDTEKNPVVYKLTTDDGGTRPIITIIATKSNGEVYWRQVFYKSTGTASKKYGAWFPISAVVPGGAGFVKKDNVDSDYFETYDMLYQSYEPVEENDIRARVKTFSFLIASNMLNSGMIGNIERDLYKVLNDDKRELLEEVRRDILSKTADDLASAIPKDGDTVSELTLPKNSLEDANNDPYKLVNNWIGTDNYLRTPAINSLYDYYEPSLLPRVWGGHRKQHRRTHRRTHCRRSHKRSTRRRRIHRRR